VSAYAFYVGMSYGACAVAIVAEAMFLRARRRRAREEAKA
jgi:heme exporter protein CcmD